MSIMSHCGNIPVGMNPLRRKGMPLGMNNMMGDINVNGMNFNHMNNFNGMMNGRMTISNGHVPMPNAVSHVEPLQNMNNSIPMGSLNMNNESRGSMMPSVNDQTNISMPSINDNMGSEASTILMGNGTMNSIQMGRFQELAVQRNIPRRHSTGTTPGIKNSTMNNMISRSYVHNGQNNQINFYKQSPGSEFSEIHNTSLHSNSSMGDMGGSHIIPNARGLDAYEMNINNVETSNQSRLHVHQNNFLMPCVSSPAVTQGMLHRASPVQSSAPVGQLFQSRQDIKNEDQSNQHQDRDQSNTSEDFENILNEIKDLDPDDDLSDVKSFYSKNEEDNKNDSMSASSSHKKNKRKKRLQRNISSSTVSCCSTFESVDKKSVKTFNSHHHLRRGKDVIPLLNRLTKEEKIVYLARHALAGTKVNGFFRGTGLALRHKKQKVWQYLSKCNNPTDLMQKRLSMGIKRACKNERQLRNKTSGRVGIGIPVKPPSCNFGTEDPQNAEEQIKKITLNGRLARKLTHEFDIAIDFCDTMEHVIKSVLAECKGLKKYDEGWLGSQHEIKENVSALLNDIKNKKKNEIQGANSFIVKKEHASCAEGSTIISDASSHKTIDDESKVCNSPGNEAQPNIEDIIPFSSKHFEMKVEPRLSKNDDSMEDKKSTCKDLMVSTLRNDRDYRQHEGYFGSAQNYSNIFNLSELNSSTEAAYTKFAQSRFRTLRRGDYVAAKPQSHDLWILARVMKEWNEIDIPALDLMKLSKVKRDAALKVNVAIQDVDTYDPDDPTKVKFLHRKNVLPLPSSYEEAASWGSRYVKGARVYAMFPSTTSLYPATVVDNTTYCQGRDDIIVVRFDDDEDDKCVQVERHIPARFVTLIPKEFPASQVKPSCINVKRKSI
eukprot:CAMPEP_0184866050 /NCGR_PEP_ID=MMETSP0580-20130426/20493_1 /TAXON_ID=1118495 /ORGANISM="Dactyliosolen fragilissimus" /LENGTH=885 /DNA_ID=CAMNT_0027365503 /DNA_START=160 /DNA_END=2817 /DNA_ORIENTATION=-